MIKLENTRSVLSFNVYGFVCDVGRAGVITRTVQRVGESAVVTQRTGERLK